MPDEVSIFAKLGSWLYGSLIHTTGVLGRAFEADVTAVRIFEASNLTQHTAFVDAARLGLTHQQDAALQSWPVQAGSLFDQLQGVGRLDGVFRALDKLKLSAIEQEALFAGLGGGVQVRDCLVLAFPIAEPVWCAIVLIRVGQSPLFTTQHLQGLEQVKPAVTHLIRSGCQRQGMMNALVAKQDDEGSPPRLTSEQLISRLTRMECQVLHYLRLGCTERQLSMEIHRSQHTVHVHVKNIYRKLNVSSRKQLMELFNDTSLP